MSKQNKKRFWILLSDGLLIPFLFLCEWLSDMMLATTSTCAWTLLGGKCLTCGGTHFVNSFLNFRFIEAWQHNEFLFLIAVVLAVSLIMLNLYLLFDLKFAKAVLKKIYNIPVLIISISMMFVFILIRNIPTFITIAKLFLAAAEKAS